MLGGKYRLGPVLGTGGVATVYRATHLWTERDVAVKVLNPKLPHYERLREGFLREARATVQLEHPNVVDVLDMGEDNWETAYMVMELLQGPTLHDVLHEHGPLSEEETLAVLLPLIDALEKAHELGIVHRDFKPENIMLTVDAYGTFTPKLLDFGVAEILENARSKSLSSDSNVIMGTPHYMSPEQARNERRHIGPHTDVWGVGVVWYECLTGHLPFDGASAVDVLQAVCFAPIDFEPLPQAYVPLLRGALERSPVRRIRTLSELKARVLAMGLHSVGRPAPGGFQSTSPWETPERTGVRRTAAEPEPESIPLVRRAMPKAEPVVLPVARGTHRSAAVAGIALTVAVALAAWWTVRSPESGSPPPPIATETDAASERAPQEPVVPEPPAPSELAAPEPVAAEPAVEAMPSDAAATPPSPEETSVIEVEPEPATVARRPRKSRRQAAPRPSEKPGPSDSPGYESPPDLVTEW